jgi:hypothetical protein
MAVWHRKRDVAAFLLILVAEDDDKLPRRRNQKQPTRQRIQRREERGVYHQLVQELALEDPEAYRNIYRHSKEPFFTSSISLDLPWKKALALSHQLSTIQCFRG